MVCSCLVLSKCVLLQIIFCSCIIGTTFSSNPVPRVLVPLDKWSEKRELLEQPFWNDKGNNRILPIQFHAVCIYGACLKWLLPELSISAAGQKDHGLWRREWFSRENGWLLSWAARKWSKYKTKLGDEMIKQLLSWVIAKYHNDLSVSRQSIICLSLQRQQIIDHLATGKLHYHSMHLLLSFHWPRAHHVTCK